MPHLFTLPGPRNHADTIGGTQFLAPGRYTIDADTAIYGSFNRLFNSTDSWIDFTNRGTIWNTSPDNIGVAVTGDYIWNFTNTGLIVSETPNGNADGIFVGDGTDVFDNLGAIYAVAAGNANGVVLWWPTVLVANSGIIAAYAPQATAGAGVGSATGLALFNGGTVINYQGGAILAEGLDATAVLYSSGTPFGDTGIYNDGRIEAYSLTAGVPSYGIRAGGADYETVVLVNNGLLKGDIAWSSYGTHPVYSPMARDHITNNAGGQIVGAVETGRGDDQIVNAGTMTGDVRTGDENDLFDTSQGSWSGVADMGWNDDEFRGSAAGDVAKGSRGGDRLFGNGGNDLLLGGVGDDWLNGGAGSDGLYGETGNDRIETAGGDSAFGGDGDDLIVAGDLRFALIDGGAGSDMLSLGAAGLHLDLAAAIATGRLRAIEAIGLQNSQQIAVRAGDAATLAGGVLDIAGGSANLVDLVGGWTESRSSFRHGALYRCFTLGAETVYVRWDVAVAIGAVVPPGFTGLDAVDGGGAPAAGSVTGGDLSDPVLTISNYFLDRDTIIDAGETWQSVADPVINGESSSADLINKGLITASTSSGIVYGIGGFYVDTFINSGTLRVSATGAAYAVGYAPDSRGKLDNSGLIEATTADGTVQAVKASWDSDGVIFMNSGVVRATSVHGAAIGAVIVRGPGSQTGPFATNAGRIEATGAAGTIALELDAGGHGAFVNLGVILAQNSAASGAHDALAVQLYNGNFFFPVSQFVNEGSLTGVVAIRSLSGNDEILNRGQIAGDIVLDAGSDCLVNSGAIAGAITLGAGNDVYWAAAGQQQGSVSGGDGLDMLVGTAGGDALSGDSGDDLLAGLGGADQLSGGDGRDIFAFTAAADSTAAAFDTITDFTTGSDRIDLTALNVQSVSITAQAGYNLLSVATDAGTLTVHVVGAIQTADLILAQAASIAGTANADLLHATAGGSILLGGDGDDSLIGAAGADRLDGGGGADVMWGGGGNDVYVVDNGLDFARELPGQGTDTIELKLAGDRYFMPDNVENLVASAGAIVNGNSLANTITGSGEDDNISGGDGRDTLIGGAGNDWLKGDGGGDTLTGGAGADRFVFWATSDSYDGGARSDGGKIMPDIITDFTSGQDVIDLSEIAYDPATGSHNLFTFLGTGAFTHHAGEIRYVMAGDQAHIYIDVDGDGAADMHIIAVTPLLQATDFVV